ncbi:glycerol transporter [Lobosporangium transversale]|uniref:MBOAT, membrane-bound O-acyltransferase family-domain-containing protein n=1 Tax=Lobosporangium transversale TaxID=64571 RepID=A0A1Y2H6C3_9FUNG|nr:MBOAT, membrane-bound O-acyltransferase family-domain-containing protein [Lobosporangium transversale]KAF9916877.1 glycerol transporter [Lobosporangium transversale]ORZ28612.1 MBOAT, membrane-bound O-acyltransferase family-domain-containing protein [Lobosporangium transversale]|eukprot:XP_021886285.1 MBOAT, membrane-bound O-acyltransferase family-domain-containing protein [Lobosporangium transversale]
MTGHQEQEQHPLLHVNNNNNNNNDVGQQDLTDKPSTSGTQSTYKKRAQDRSTNPPLWYKKEFYIYYFAFVTIVPYMFKTAHDASSESNPNYEKYKDLLSDGFFGYKVDNSDEQYANFRNNLPTLTLVCCFYLPFSHLFRRIFVPVTPVKSPLQPLYRTYFFLAFSILYLYFMYGNSILKIGTIVSINYAIAKLGGSSRLMPALTWIFNISILFLNESHQGYKFSSLHGSLAWLDNHSDMYGRWDVNFNFTMLRLVSFNLDYYWSLKQKRENIPKEEREKGVMTDKERVNTPTFAEDYNFIYYLAFALYAPLYVAGPIMTFNDFISQLRYPKHITSKALSMWVIRLIICLSTMEFTMHYMHMVAISKRQAWENDPILQICMIGLFNLILIWLKLMIIWRFFRLWALLDGIEAPENMIRCVVNNYSALGFWRSWHKSYNLWILRYIYIPLGGTQYAIYNIWIVFTFVAVWHDINLKLLAWGWLISLFILPEIIASKVFSKKKWGKWPYYRHLCAVGAVSNIMLMMIANLVGFCIGVDGMKIMLHDLFSTLHGWLTMFCCFGAIFICAQLQFEVREEEKRRGVFLNC